MNLFYSDQIADNIITLSEEESRHCVSVLRQKVGDEIRVTDGVGNMYTTKIIDAHKKHTRVQIIETETIAAERDYTLHIAIAPTKSTDRIEWFIEKSIEIGIDEITFLQTKRSERKKTNMDRADRVSIAAMKQSLKAHKTVINDLVDFSSFIKQNQKGERFIAFCETGEEELLSQRKLKGKQIILLIGPEGDFTEDEVEIAKNNGYTPVSLGSSRLRTETAGIQACSWVAYANSIN